MKQSIRRILLCSVILMLFYASLFGIDTQSIKVKLKSSDLVITVQYEKKRRDIALFYLKKAAIYVPALEQYLDVPFPREDFFIFLDENPGHANNFGDGVRLVNRHLNTPMPAVLFHEINHFYYRGFENRWAIEGINSFLPIAIEEEGLLSKNAAEYDNVVWTWELSKTIEPFDSPVENDFRQWNFDFFYRKTFKIQYMIFKELGHEKYRKLVADFAKRIRSPLFSYFLNSNSFVRILYDYRDIDWKKFLSGWVYNGPYTIFGFTDFAVTNGTIRIDEFYKKFPEGPKLN